MEESGIFMQMSSASRESWISEAAEGVVFWAAEGRARSLGVSDCDRMPKFSYWFAKRRMMEEPSQVLMLQMAVRTAVLLGSPQLIQLKCM